MRGDLESIAQPPPARRGHGFALILFGVVFVVWVGAIVVAARDARLSADASGRVIAVFPLSTSRAEGAAAVARAGGVLLSDGWLPFLWIASSEEAGFAGRLSAEGAIAVYPSLTFKAMIAGCFTASFDPPSSGTKIVTP